MSSLKLIIIVLTVTLVTSSPDDYTIYCGNPATVGDNYIFFENGKIAKVYCVRRSLCQEVVDFGTAFQVKSGHYQGSEETPKFVDAHCEDSDQVCCGFIL